MTITRKTGFNPRIRGTSVMDGLVLGAKTIPTDITFAIADGASTITEVEISVVNEDGFIIPGVHALDVYLSDAATGVGITGTTASGTVQAKSASGTDIGILTSKKALRVTTLATGIYTLEITDSAKTGFYVAVASGIIPVQVSRQLVTADYGA